MTIRKIANGKITNNKFVNHTFTLTGLIATLLVFTTGIQIATIAMQPDPGIAKLK